jgi:hypothetical protein
LVAEFGCVRPLSIPKPKSRRNFFRAVFSFLIESPFTQTMRVALAALCNFYDPGGNDFLHDLFRVPEAVNVIHCPCVKHQTSP